MKLENTINSEDFERNVLSKIEGVFGIIDAMRLSEENGAHIYQPQMFDVLSDILSQVTKNAKKTRDLMCIIEEKAKIKSNECA